MEPEHSFIRAHFYAPTKKVFGVRVDTFAVNVVVLWLMTIMFYIILYFRLLKKALDSGEVVMGKKKHYGDKHDA
jgi:heme O synthase-like polyprenyltransferase